MRVIRALPSVIVLAAFMLVISSTRDSRAEIYSMTATIARTNDEGIVREIRTNGYIPKNSEIEIREIAAWSLSMERVGRRKNISRIRSHSQINIARS